MTPTRSPRSNVSRRTLGHRTPDAGQPEPGRARRPEASAPPRLRLPADCRTLPAERRLPVVLARERVERADLGERSESACGQQHSLSD
jgi:hypothetical protein